MDYEIIVTLGPASADDARWRALLQAGASGFRLNTSHLTPEALGGWLERLVPYLNGFEIPLILDLQGSKWRLGHFTPFTLEAGQAVDLVQAAETQQSSALPVPHADFFAGASPGDEVVLDDAKVRLQVEQVGAGRSTARVTLGGPIQPNKGITLSNSEVRREALSEKDQQIIALSSPYDHVHYAISYIKDAAEMRSVRELFGTKAHLIAKLERGSAMEEAAQIAEHADALWVCRGDLGAELGLPAMAEAVWKVSEQVRELRVPAIMAGQVLEHMTTSPTPTRSEVCYIHDCLMKGYRGFVLSDETAVGKYPIEACKAAAAFRMGS